MTRQEFCEQFKKMSNDISFKISGIEYHIYYLPVCRENGEFGYDELLIGVRKEIIDFFDAHENDTGDIDWFTPYAKFKTLDDMLEGYLIGGVPLGEQLDKIYDLWWVICV